MSRKTKTVPLSKISDIQATLKKKAASPKNISLQDLVHNLASPIQEMLDAGYSYEDVSEVFRGHSVDVAASGIKNYHRKAVITPSQPSNETSAETSSTENGSPDVSPPESPDASPPEPVTKPSPSPSRSKSPRAKKTSEEDDIRSQFNLIDRSSI
ncbi:MAG: hypothetical protein H0X31_00640 [Nostocaceae cyanobacterium]|nr:hypothetical protein [Nostocaceae cyanobacterium]